MRYTSSGASAAKTEILPVKRVQPSPSGNETDNQNYGLIHYADADRNNVYVVGRKSLPEYRSFSANAIVMEKHLQRSKPYLFEIAVDKEAADAYRKEEPAQITVDVFTVACGSATKI